MNAARVVVADLEATDGDIAVPRPGMLDMLGRAKWYVITRPSSDALADRNRDSWNKQKGVDQVDAKRLYVSTLQKVRD